MDGPSDAAVVASVLAGEIDAFGVLVRRYGAEYKRYATRMLGDSDEAEDALQRAFIRAYRALKTCGDPSRFGAWLFRIVVNECRTLVDSRRRRAKWFVTTEDLPAAAVSGPDQGTREEIEMALAKLPADQREAFVMKYVEEMSYEDMADATGVGVSALKMRTKRACDRLRELLEEPVNARA